VAGLRIKLQAGWQIIGGKSHRPVTGRGNGEQNGEPGRTPKISAPLMRGLGEESGVKMTATSAGALIVSN